MNLCSYKFPIGWTDISCPHGWGYVIMTEEGLKVYDLDEYANFKEEVERVKNYIREMEG